MGPSKGKERGTDMETIKSIESGKTAEVKLVADSGEDMMSGILGGCRIEHDGDAWVVADDDELAWWVEWAETEPMIWAARENADEATAAEDDRLIADLGSDMGRLQEAECKLFGIER